jgi:ElaB/YqjD/DUF883 family membrane-anchored ribosome-binding protein
MAHTHPVVRFVRTWSWLALVVGAGALSPALLACNSASIAVREGVFGQAKREQLVDRVKDARDAQGEAKEQFASALDEFLALTGQSGGELEAKYRTLQKELDRSKDRAADVRGRIDKVESVGGSLFREWARENAEYKSEDLRRRSEQMLRDTQRQYDQLVIAMRQAEGKMQPVLDALGDQVRFLKHNLNARAVAGLQGEASRIEGDVSRLIADMQRSIDEANEFINQMSQK